MKALLSHVRASQTRSPTVTSMVSIPKPDAMMARAVQFVKWLAKENPQGRWETFLTEDNRDLRWDRVIIAGSSHGSTTAARFAIHQRVDRVVMFCGPRDQHETWQGLPSATPSNRFFGFSHVLDGGWVGDHYCRSWELLGLHQYGEIVDVDQSQERGERRLSALGVNWTVAGFRGREISSPKRTLFITTLSFFAG